MSVHPRTWRSLPWQTRAAIAALDVVTWPLWWLLDRGSKR